MHEQEHLKRMKQQGVIKFYAKYLMVPEFRFNEELMATQPQFTYLKSQGLSYDLKRKARQLSGWLYFGSTNYPTALNAVTRLWGDA